MRAKQVCCDPCSSITFWISTAPQTLTDVRPIEKKKERDDNSNLKVQQSVFNMLLIIRDSLSRLFQAVVDVVLNSTICVYTFAPHA